MCKSRPERCCIYPVNLNRWAHLLKFSSHEISQHTLWLLPPIFSTVHLSDSREGIHWTMPLLKFDFTLCHQPLLQMSNSLQASSHFSSLPLLPPPHPQIHCPSSSLGSLQDLNCTPRICSVWIGTFSFSSTRGQDTLTLNHACCLLSSLQHGQREDQYQRKKNHSSIICIYSRIQEFPKCCSLETYLGWQHVYLTCRNPWASSQRCINWVWWYTPAIPSIRTWRKEDQKFSHLWLRKQIQGQPMTHKSHSQR